MARHQESLVGGNVPGRAIRRLIPRPLRPSASLGLTAMAPGNYSLHRRLAEHGGRMIMTETQTLFDEGTSSEELAYMLLEEARLRCKSLLEEERASSDDAGALTVDRLYGELGIAGYYASARLEPDRRRELLALAHTRSRRQEDPDSGSVRQLTDVTAAATRSVERALALTGLLVHIHLAYVHVMSACETLDCAVRAPGVTPNRGSGC
jgi:hypothetical protein